MKLNALTGTRGIAAIMVVIFHFGGAYFPFNLIPALFSTGYMAVSYFFVLSGFVLYISRQQTSWLSFLVRRIVRIAPAYLIALLIFVIVYIIYKPPVPSALPKQIVITALMIQSFFPDYVLKLNSPGWSVSVEFFFYIVFPLMLLFCNKKGLFVMLTIIAFLISQSIHLYYFRNIDPLTGSGIFFNPLMHLSQFMTGICGGMLFEGSGKVYARNKILPVLLSALLIFMLLYKPDSLSYQAGLISPLFMLLILSIAVNGSKWLSYPFMVFLGEISYGIYIYQLPIFKATGYYFDRNFHWSGQGIFWVSFVVLIIVSTLSYYFVEQPLLKLVKKNKKS